MDECIHYIVALTIDGLITLYLSNQYFSAKKLFDAFTRSIAKGINCLDGDEESTQLVVVRGKVKSIGSTIKSSTKPFTSGVIQKLTVKKYPKRTSFGWVNDEEILEEKKNVVPFQLVNGKFKITIASPLEAQFLDLEMVKPPSNAFLGLLFGAQKRGVQHTEYMLKEGSTLTGFGEIQNQNGLVQLIPPKNGMCYILTTMDPNTISNVLDIRKKHYGSYCVIFGLIGIIITGALVYKYWKARVRRKKLQQMTELQERSRNTNNIPPDADFTCIICYTNPREMVLLPCGHITMCADCTARYTNDSCPVCRQHVACTALIFIS